MDFASLSSFLPEVARPHTKRVPFKDKMKWSLIILVFFYILGYVPLFGLGENALQQFEFLSIILGASFGSIISLGIGPIVTASIVLQLMVGTKIIDLDLSVPGARQKFQGWQRSLSVAFIIIEAIVYVAMGGLAPSAVYAGTALYTQLQILLMVQLMIGGFLIMLMDDVISKWGFGSGLSLFIAAGVSQQVFVRALNFLPSPTQPDVAAGAIPSLIQFLSMGDVTSALIQLAGLLSTLAVFAICVYGQSLKVEIPLSMGRVRGHSFKWPLNFFYTSNIPVILVAALLANIQLFGTLLSNWGLPLLGTFDNGVAVSGLVYWIASPDVLRLAITGGFTWVNVLQAVMYTLVMVVGSVIFSIFWMQTANMDASSQAKQIMRSGLQIPGFRRDERVLEKVLSRYVWTLTIVGGAAVGLLGALADLTGALSQGTGILLAVMIVYKLYEEIARDHMMDMHPALKKFME